MASAALISDSAPAVHCTLWLMNCLGRRFGKWLMLMMVGSGGSGLLSTYSCGSERGVALGILDLASFQTWGENCNCWSYHPIWKIVFRLVAGVLELAGVESPKPALCQGHITTIF